MNSAVSVVSPKFCLQHDPRATRRETDDLIHEFTIRPPGQLGDNPAPVGWTNGVRCNDDEFIHLKSVPLDGERSFANLGWRPERCNDLLIRRASAG
jgi:hypothetical protein